MKSKLISLGAICFLLVTFNALPGRSQAETDAVAIAIGTPNIVASHGVNGDQRDIDIYPVIAFDALNQRFLVVWMTIRNADSSSDGFDLYGIFLDVDGQPSGEQFRISDNNNAARNAPPAVVAGAGRFVVAWGVRGETCGIAVQEVNDTSNLIDQPFNWGLSVHQHSPKLVYNATTQHFAVAFAAGDDYLPPLFSGATINTVADCGHNANSSSELMISEFHFESGTLAIDKNATVSELAGGAFRPALAYNSTLDQYLLTWEDRRNAAGERYHFNVYGQQLTGELNANGGNLSLTEGNYETGDGSATWTPRPAVVASKRGFLATWFEQERNETLTTWRVQGQRFNHSASEGGKIEMVHMPFAQSHPGEAPTGWQTVLYSPTADEFLLALASYTESFAGYLASVRLQRVSSSGALLRPDGSARPSATGGDKLDLSLETQLAIGAAAFSATQVGALIVYSKHATGSHSQDFDIWGNQITFGIEVPTETATSTTTPTAPVNTPTVTPSPLPQRQYLPLITR